MRISDWSSDVCSSDLIHPSQAASDVRTMKILIARGGPNSGTGKQTRRTTAPRCHFCCIILSTLSNDVSKSPIFGPMYVKVDRQNRDKPRRKAPHPRGDLCF